jgi:hypothetical protein
MPDETYVIYHELKCWNCGNNLTRTNSIDVTFVCADYRFTRMSRVDASGRLQDLDRLLEHGHHAGSACASCGEQLEELMPPDEDLCFNDAAVDACQVAVNRYEEDLQQAAAKNAMAQHAREVHPEHVVIADHALRASAKTVLAYQRLRETMAEAASAPGKDWLEWQLRFGRALQETQIDDPTTTP